MLSVSVNVVCAGGEKWSLPHLFAVHENLEECSAKNSETCISDRIRLFQMLVDVILG